MEPLTQKQRYQRRLAALKSERESWVSHWRELADYVLPRKARLLASDRSSAGQKRNQNIINGTATWASRVLASGMMAGITSPARPWFRLTTPDPELAEFGSVREWLHLSEERLREAFAKSNVYNVLHGMDAGLGVFGTAAGLFEEDVEDGLRGYLLPLGSFSLATSARQRVDTVYRELQLSVGQLVEQFGLKACSQRVQNLYTEGQLDTWVDVVHVLEPHRDVQPGLIGPRGMAWTSCWHEAQGGPDEGMLRMSGYQEFPVLAPRWDVTGEDVYGSSPGMDALGDIRALQVLERRKGQLVDKLVNPPMRGPSNVARASLLPGDFTPYDGSTTKFEPAMEVHPQAVPAAAAEIREHEARIKTGFYADLWLMLSQSDSPQMTAREVAERHEEKMLQLGPVLERLQDELLDPLIDRAFAILARRGELPPPPDEMQGMDLRVEYISIMAQAQKLLGTSSIERLASFVGNLAAVKPEALDKLNIDELVDEYAGALGVKPDLVRTDEEVAAIRESRAQQMAAAQASEQATQAVQGAKVLSETDVSGDNALTRLLGNLGGTAAAGGPTLQ